ncbi:hypothetical protein E3J85_01240, partial [Patescibacteria group bacterium]
MEKFENPPEISPDQSRLEEIMDYPVIQQELQETSLRHYQQAVEDVKYILDGKRDEKTEEIAERWDDLHNLVYSERLSQKALEEFEQRMGKVTPVNLKQFDSLERAKIFKGEEGDNTFLFVEATCDQCGCKKFFETNNHSGKFNLPFANNGSVNNFVRGFASLLEQ